MDAQLRIRCRHIEAHVLGKRLRDARLAAGLTQAAVAGSAASVAHLSRIEAGLRRPTPDLLLALAEAVGVDLEALLGDARAPSADPNAVSWAEHLRASNAARATAGWLRAPRDQAAYRRMLRAVAEWESEAPRAGSG